MGFSLRSFIVFILLVAPFNTLADWSATGTVGSDYLFNGISQTNENPVLQLSLDYSSPMGFYAGAKGMNIDFADSSNIEIDYYLGIYQTVNNSNAFNFGIAQYSYLGGDNSPANNYQEVYLIWDVNQTRLSYWYAWDYFGTDPRHYVAMASHTFFLDDGYSLLISIDKSVSLDDENFSWETQDKYYIHQQLTLLFSYKDFDISLGLHHTSS